MTLETAVQVYIQESNLKNIDMSNAILTRSTKIVTPSYSETLRVPWWKNENLNVRYKKLDYSQSLEYLHVPDEQQVAPV